MSGNGIAVVVMGVAGSGKTTVANLLAERLGADMVDADDLHPAANVAKMASGTPLTDEDRWPWLEAVGRAVRERLAAGRSVVVACSALRRAYREAIAASAEAPVRFAHLDGSRELIAARMAARAGHFMPTGLLDSQFAVLEPLEADEPGFTVAIDGTPEQTADAIALRLRRNGAPPTGS
ncbi:gluconokinase [Glycomyces niveus]|nr:gluconokinase [Glycomyces sp. NEAU-S30]